MILSSLVALYDRLAADSKSGVPLLGWARRPVPLALELDRDGQAVSLIDLRDHSGKKAVSPSMAVPEHGLPRTSGARERPYFLSDHTAFILGLGSKGPTPDYFGPSRALHERLLAGCDDPLARAILAFFSSWNPARASALAEAARLDWDKEVAGQNLAFKLKDAPGYAHDRPTLRRLWDDDFAARAQSEAAQCLVTGETGPVARTHGGIKLPGTTGGGAPVVSFNADSFTSYGHESGMNAPVGERAAFAYVTALNELLRPDQRRRVSLGETFVVFWAEVPCEAETELADLFWETDTAGESTLRGALGAIRAGKAAADALSGMDPDTRFFVLGMGVPGGSRVSVRFWYVTTLGKLLENVAAHQRALRIDKRFEDKDPDFPGAFQLLRATLPSVGDAKVPEPLIAGFLRAILTGGAYPDGLLARVLARLHHDHGDYDPVSYLRIALVKACLFRGDKDKEEKFVSLDPDELDPAYRLGRLFAVLERAQQIALPDINATIKDKYFGAASATPRTVFPVLLKLAQHHLRVDACRWLEGRIEQILDPMAPQKAWPAHLKLEEQGLFALGYYHQRADLWRKKSTES